MNYDMMHVVENSLLELGLVQHIVNYIQIYPTHRHDVSLNIYDKKSFWSLK